MRKMHVTEFLNWTEESKKEREYADTNRAEYKKKKTEINIGLVAIARA